MIFLAIVVMQFQFYFIAIEKNILWLLFSAYLQTTGKMLCLHKFIVRKIRFLGNDTWWRPQMESFSALLVLCAGNLPLTGEFPSQKPVTGSFDIFFDLCLNKRLSKHIFAKMVGCLCPVVVPQGCYTPTDMLSTVSF